MSAPIFSGRVKCLTGGGCPGGLREGREGQMSGRECPGNGLHSSIELPVVK